MNLIIIFIEYYFLDLLQGWKKIMILLEKSNSGFFDLN